MAYILFPPNPFPKTTKARINRIIFNMVIIFIALGASIGAWGSIISMRRFLDA